jgi:hypothetical protein
MAYSTRCSHTAFYCGLGDCDTNPISWLGMLSPVRPSSAKALAIDRPTVRSVITACRVSEGDLW